MKYLLSICSLSLCIVSCSTQLPERFYQPALKEVVYIENYKDNYTVHLPDEDKTSQGDNPDNIIVEKNAKARPFYTVIVGADTLIVSNRHIYFKNAVNFRDIGGLKTKDGTTVKWGKIYRSDNLSRLKNKEFDKFNSLGIQTVFDLRTSGEIAGKQDNLPKNVKYIHTPIVKDSADVLASIKGQVIRGKITEEQSLQFMNDLYGSIVSENIPALRQMIKDALQSDAPILYHCSAGKDRTGIVTAMILSILNVERETIIDEYLLSDYYRREKLEGILWKAKAAKVVKPRISIGAIQNFMDVDERYINTAFNIIDTKYGGIDNYICNQLQISDKERKLIIKKFTY
jgi:protein-tyrosine phosphatase